MPRAVASEGFSDAGPAAGALLCDGPAGPPGGQRARAIGSAGERLVHTEEVTGSIPVSPTHPAQRRVASRAPAFSDLRAATSAAGAPGQSKLFPRPERVLRGGLAP